MDSDRRFTDGRVAASPIRALLSTEHRWQRWLEIEAALAMAEAEVGIVPQAAAEAIQRAASLEHLQPARIREGILRTSHPLMALVTELSEATGQPHGGWVHWGATTQNITQTGDALVVREVHGEILRALSEILTVMADLAERGSDMVCAGRTHGQQAVPITFGFKVAVWIDECERHIMRLRQLEPRLFTVMMGGAVGNFASLGSRGPAVQEAMARLLGLRSMVVPSRAMGDAQAEYVCVLALLAGSASKIAREVYLLMQLEFGEVSEPVPEGTVGSSTMPHKRNPQLADDVMAIAAQIRSLVPLAMEGMLHDHEVNGANYYMSEDAVGRASALTGDMLTRLLTILSGLTLDRERMRANLEVTGGLIASEAIMLALGEVIGRQEAHAVIYELAQRASTNRVNFAKLLQADERVTRHLSRSTLRRLLDPATKLGLSVDQALQAAERARTLASAMGRSAGAEPKFTVLAMQPIPRHRSSPGGARPGKPRD